MGACMACLVRGEVTHAPVARVSSRVCQAACAHLQRFPDSFLTITASEQLEPKLQWVAHLVEQLELSPHQGWAPFLWGRPLAPLPTDAPPEGIFESKMYTCARNEINRMLWLRMAWVCTNMLEKPHPIFGEVAYDVITLEVLARGTVHAHISLWLANADDDERVISGITGARPYVTTLCYFCGFPGRAGRAPWWVGLRVKV